MKHQIIHCLNFEGQIIRSRIYGGKFIVDYSDLNGIDITKTTIYFTDKIQGHMIDVANSPEEAAYFANNPPVFLGRKSTTKSRHRPSEPRKSKNLQKTFKHLRKKFNKRCAWCGSYLSKWNATIDHVIPRQFGGSRNSPLNFAYACKPCNKERDDCYRWFAKVYDTKLEAKNLPFIPYENVPRRIKALGRLYGMYKTKKDYKKATFCQFEIRRQGYDFYNTNNTPDQYCNRIMKLLPHHKHFPISQISDKDLEIYQKMNIDKESVISYSSKIAG